MYAVPGVLLTREQAARIAYECEKRDIPEMLVQGSGGDLQIYPFEDDGVPGPAFIINPDGEIS